MPTTRSRVHRHLLPELTEVMWCFLLNQELPKVIGDRDTWWLVVERGAQSPDEAWWPRSARALWAQHQDQLRPAWRALNGDLPYPIDTDPVSWPGIAEASARERHKEELERRRRVVVPVRKPTSAEAAH